MAGKSYNRLTIVCKIHLTTTQPQYNDDDDDKVQ